MPKLNRSIPVLAIALCLLAGSGCTQRARTGRALERAKGDLVAQRMDEAEIEYLNVLKADHLNPQAIAGLGILYMDEGRVGRSIPFLVEAKQLQPDNREVRLRLGQYFLASGENQRALDEGNFLLAHEPGDEDASLLLARAAIGPKGADELRRRLAALPAAAAGGPAVLLALGTLEFRAGRLAEAEALLLRARTAAPSSVNVSVALGALDQARNDQAGADAAFARAAELAPDQPAIGLRYAQCKIQGGDRQAGKDLLDRITAKFPAFLPARLLRAQLAAEDGKYDESEAMIAKILARDSTYPDAMLLTGRLLLARHDPPGAVAQLEKTERIYSKSPEVEYQLAEAYLAAGSTEKASVSLSRAVALAPNYTDAILLGAQTDMDQGDFGPALVSLKDMVQKRPDLTRARLMLAEAYLGAQEPDSALAVYRAMAAALPKDPRPLLLEGLVRERQGDRVEARRLFAAALALAPGYSPVLQREIALDIEEKRYDAARRGAEELIGKDPKLPEAQILLGRVFAAQKAWPEAEAALQKAIQLQPEDPAAYLILARIYTAAGEDKKARADLEAIIAKNPRETQALMLLAGIATQAGDYAGAANDYARILAVAPGSGPALNNLAWLCADKLGQLDRGAGLAKRARIALPRDPRVADTLGWILYRQGNYREAASFLAEGAANLPAEREIQFHLGMTYFMLGEEGASRVALDRALQPGPDFPGMEEARRRRALLAIDGAAAGSAERAALEKAAADEPHGAIVLSKLAAAYARDRAWDKAAALCAAALQGHEDDAPLLAQLADIRAAQGRLPEAFALAKKAHALAPRDADISGSLGRLAFRTGNFSWAADLMREAAARKPNDPDVLFDLAQASYSVGGVAEAEQAMRRAVQAGAAFPRAGEGERFLDLIELAGDPAKADASADRIGRALASDPQDVPGLMAMGAACEQRGDTTEAKKDYEKALLRFPGFFPANRRLALVCADHPEGDTKALELAAKAWEAYPGDPAVAKACGIVAYHMGNYAAAERLLEDASGTGPDDGERIFYLGMARHRLKEPADRETLRRALALPLRADLAAEARKALGEAK